MCVCVSRVVCVCLCHSQGPELGHVVEAGHWDAADVVVVQGSVKHQRDY